MTKLRYVLCMAALVAAFGRTAQAQKALFPEIDTNFAGSTVTVPGSPFSYKILFRQDESIVKTADGKSGLAKGNHDFTAYIPIEGSSEHGWLVVNHELRDSNSTFGDGGGMTVFEVRRQGGEWNVVGDFRNVDFSTVGGTHNNCGGATTPAGMVFTAEEYEPSSNSGLFNGGKNFRDTSDVTITFDGQPRTLKRWQTVGWMVEVDPVNARATQKLWKMGRYSHEGGWCMPDGKTVYLTDDGSPAVLFKFVATTAHDYSDGQLYAYKQSSDGKGGEWLTLPMELDSLMVIRDVAIRMGATMFIRHEWVVEVNGKLYITETGLDNFNWDEDVANGGVPARHLERVRVSESNYAYEDFYGRVLELDPATNAIRVYIEGGFAASDPSKNFSNPDGLSVATIDGEEWLIINEDLNGRTAGRVSKAAEEAGRTICEIYSINPKVRRPTVDNLKRLLIGPNGAETTGGVSTPDGKTYFVNIQHPSGSNPPPFNKSATIALTGFDRYLTEDDFRLFPPVDTNFAGQTVIIPANPFKYKVLFREGESMVKTSGGATGLAKGAHDFTAWVPIDGSSEHGWLVVNHELRDSNSTFGDGGGMTAFEVRWENGEWMVIGDYRNVDFSTVGGTFVNCGGAQTPYGTVLTAEEYPPASNAELFNGGKNFRDTSDVTISFDGSSRTLARWQNMGWMVEVDPENARATRKLWKMGRFSHEGGWCMADGRTVYLTDDFDPAVLFKFVATTANDYSDGQLYAYKQSEDGESGQWLTLPMELDSLLVIRDVAIRMGATLFIRHEWVTEANGKIYLTETGLDAFNWDDEVAMGGVPAKHFESLRVSGLDHSYEDYYGRVLELDPATNRIRPFVEGGNGTWNPETNFSNPDGIATMMIKGKEWLVINEDLNGRTAGRVPKHAEEAGRTICEIYFLDPTLSNPTVDDLKRLLIGPTGAETTGGVATADGKTYFVNIQHPSGSNPPPFNKSATIAVTGFDLVSGVLDPESNGEASFRVFPNPAVGTLRFSRITDVALYNGLGEQILVKRNAGDLDVSGLTPGVYYLQTIDGETAKLIVE